MKPLNLTLEAETDEAVESWEKALASIGVNPWSEPMSEDAAIAVWVICGVIVACLAGLFLFGLLLGALS